MADPTGANMTLAQAERADLTDPVARDLSLYTRVYQLREDADNADSGVAPSLLLELATNPTAADTVTLGGQVFEFQATAGQVTDDSYVAVEIGATAADTRDNVVLAFNATYADDEHPNITKTDGVTPAKANSVIDAVAFELGSFVQVQPASRPGGDRVYSDPTLATASSLTAGTDGWNAPDMADLGGKADGASSEYARATVTVTTAMLDRAFLRFGFDFVPVSWRVSVRTAGGVMVSGFTDALTGAGTDLTLSFAGGAGDIADTDIVTVEAWN